MNSLIRPTNKLFLIQDYKMTKYYNGAHLHQLLTYLNLTENILIYIRILTGRFRVGVGLVHTIVYLQGDLNHFSKVFEHSCVAAVCENNQPNPNKSLTVSQKKQLQFLPAYTPLKAKKSRPFVMVSALLLGSY